VQVLAAIFLVLQGAASTKHTIVELQDGLDTLYGGQFERAASYFAALAARHPADPAPVVFQAGAYIWWAAARDSADFALQRIDSLLGVALIRAHAGGNGSADFWLATALGYRARQREEHGHAYSAARDAKAMRDIYRRLLAADSSCADCYLGLGVYEYGLARASALARFFARLIGLGSGNAERGIRYMRHAAHDGDLARVESTWVLAAALMREAARDPAGRPVLEAEARGYVEMLARRYPDNPVFQRFLREVPARTSAGKAVRAAAGAATVAIGGTPSVRRCERGQFAEHVVYVTLDGVRRDVEPLRDLFVAEPRGDQFLDLLLPFGEADVGGGRPHRWAGVECGLARSGGEGCWRQGQIGAAGDGADRFHDVFRARVLHDEAVGAAVDELMHVLLRGDEIHNDCFGVGGGRLEIREERVTVAVGEAGIEQHDLRLGIAQKLRGGVGAVGARDDVDVGERAEQSRQAVAHQPVVFDDEHANAGGENGRGTCAALCTPAVRRSIALRRSIIHSAPTLGRDPTLDTANSPRHTPPPFLDVMYLSPGTSGIPPGDELIHAESLL
jgi:hypothetical protein